MTSRTKTLLLLVSPCLVFVLCSFAKPSDYAIVVSEQTHRDKNWRSVVDCLLKRHHGALILYEGSIDESLPELRKLFPRYACFVAQPGEISREYVARIHRLTRQLDDDPYTDCFWGILTGYDAANALRIARHQEPLTVRNVASGTEIALEMCQQGCWFSELEAGRMVQKEKGGSAKDNRVATDTTMALGRAFDEADLFVTSGHATEHDWQIGYRYRNGQFRCGQGALYGVDLQGRKVPFSSAKPKLYLPVGNCLMGHIDGTNCMTLAFLNNGVNQMIGYTVVTWYGYAGWGCLDYFLEQPGRYTLAEAFFANQAALIQRLESTFPGSANTELDANGQPAAPLPASAAAHSQGLNANDARGLFYDRDTVAFYGDPAWEARMAEGPKAWEQHLTAKGRIWTFEVKPNRGESSFDPISRNGAQRGGRPIVQFFPRRLSLARLIEGADLKPVITDKFILVPNPGRCDLQRKYRVVFEISAD